MQYRHGFQLIGSNPALPTKTLQAIEEFFFCRQFSRFSRSFGTALPTKTLQAIEEFFLYSDFLKKIGKIKKHIFKIVQSITIILIHYF
ncbi:hypothetical protein DR980_06760 [Flavobacterium psychrolimnae]|uniref:Uncharacterized protein n=1 Tax=Flavobacterium psychrolimnae TaxID=249351 RepID=A0A366B0R7_9FLAO|nr:hypothetical protein DR980_06760 [Flavobacterium psychrolimnae]